MIALGSPPPMALGLWAFVLIPFVSVSGQEFGVFLGHGPSTICFDGALPPIRGSFTVCSFLNIHQPVPSSEIFRFNQPNGISFIIGLTYYGLFIRVTTRLNALSSSKEDMAATTATTADERYFFEVTLPPKRWRGVCLTYDGIKKEARAFIDGKEEAVSSVKTLKASPLKRNESIVQLETFNSRAKRYDNATAEKSERNDGVTRGYISIYDSATTELNKHRDNLTLAGSIRMKRQTEKPICAGSDEFEGELAGLSVWNDVLVDTEGMRKSNCKRAKLASAGNILNMNNEWRFYGNSSKRSYVRTNLCSNLDTALIVKPAGSFIEANDFCTGVGGHLSEPAVINEELLRIATGTNQSCVAWDKTTSWLTHTITNPKIETKFCEALDENGKIIFITCVRRLSCSLCIAPIERFTLYGHSGEYFNYVYYLFSDQLGEAKWVGVRGSSIKRRNNTWVVESTEHTTKLSTGSISLPIGRRNWRWSAKLPGRTQEILLTFTVCRTSEFSCEDGQCIAITKRCDDVIDCRDNTDEKDCNVIRRPKGYDTMYIPPLRPGEKSPAALGYHVDVYNLGRITTDEGRARIDLGLTMTWFDPRIEFNNLKPVEKNYFECNIVWLPRIRALTGHGDGSVLDINNYEKFCYVYADDQDEIRALTDPFMGYVSPGGKYPIKYYMGMLADVPCEFNFVRYPFDQQMCNMSFMIMNTPGLRYYQKYTEGVTVPYLNKKTILLEYKLMNITTEVGYTIRGNDNNTYFVITMHLRRLYGYHIMNSFFPSLLMGLVSYSTFYFQVDDFTNRIMVSLTAQLVLAALFTSTTASSVKTPYLKMIDVWYACIIAFCFLIVIAQVLVDAARNKVESDYKQEAENRIAETYDETDPRRKRTLREQLKIPMDFVVRVNTIMKAILISLLMFFVFIYSVVAAGFY